MTAVTPLKYGETQGTSHAKMMLTTRGDVHPCQRECRTEAWVKGEIQVQSVAHSNAGVGLDSALLFVNSSQPNRHLVHQVREKQRMLVLHHPPTNQIWLTVI